MTKQNGHPDNHPQPLYVTMILDETGSMEETRKGAAIAGFNQYLASLQQEPAETRFTLTLFNAEKTEVRYRDVPVAAVQRLDGGGVYIFLTMERRSTMRSVRTLSGARLEAPKEAKKLCVILTDGEENASPRIQSCIYL